MDIEIEVWLTDIIISIDQINDFMQQGTIQYNAYTNNLMLKKAVERNLEIIGEASNRIVKKDPTISISGSRQAIAARNRIIHSYEKISDEIIYGIVKRHLPLLRVEVENLLKQGN